MIARSIIAESVRKTGYVFGALGIILMAIGFYGMHQPVITMIGVFMTAIGAIAGFVGGLIA